MEPTISTTFLSTTSTNSKRTNNNGNNAANATIKSKGELHKYQTLKKKWFSKPREQLKSLPTSYYENNNDIMMPSSSLSSSSPERREIIFLKENNKCQEKLFQPQHHQQQQQIARLFPKTMSVNHEKFDTNNDFIPGASTTSFDFNKMLSFQEKDNSATNNNNSKKKDDNDNDECAEVKGGDPILNSLLNMKEYKKLDNNSNVITPAANDYILSSLREEPTTTKTITFGQNSMRTFNETIANSQQSKLPFSFKMDINNNEQKQQSFSKGFSFPPMGNNNDNDNNVLFSKPPPFSSSSFAFNNQESKNNTILSSFNNNDNTQEQTSSSLSSFNMPSFNKPSSLFAFNNQEPNKTNTNSFLSSATNTNQPPPPQQSTTINYKEKVEEIYKKYNPLKLSNIDILLLKYKGQEDVLLKKLEQKYNSSNTSEILISPPLPNTDDPICFMDIAIDDKVIGTIHIQLFQKHTPKTCDNFRQLCTGEAGPMDSHFNKILHYKNSSFHRIIPNFMMQGGDFTNHDGTGGTSIYKGTSYADMWGKFPDEKPFISHSRKGLLSMANNGPNKNGSQFFITLSNKLSHLDGKHVVFGQVIKGYDDVLEYIINTIDIDKKRGDKPIQNVAIVDCGEVKDGVCVKPFPSSPVKR